MLIKLPLSAFEFQDYMIEHAKAIYGTEDQ